MKAREPDIKVQRWVAMLQAADLIEREGHYDFMCNEIPRRCDDVACVLGWVGHCAGTTNADGGVSYWLPISRTAEWLGYADQFGFYRAMTRACGDEIWHDDHATAAKALRKLAEEVSS